MTDKVNLIIANYATGKIITKNGLSGSNLSEISAPYGSPGGLTFDHNTGQLISSYFPTGANMGKIIIHVGVTAAVSSEFAILSAGGDPSKITKPLGLAFDGTNIIAVVSDEYPVPFGSRYIAVFSGKTATVTDRIDIPSTSIVGLSWDGENLVYVDQTEDEVYILVGKTGVVGSHFPAPYWGAYEQPWGVAWDGITLTVVDHYYDRHVRCKYPSGVYIGNYASSTYVFGCTVDGRIVAPTVTSEEADGVTTSQANLHAEVTDAGGETLDLLRQFEYKKGIGGAVNTVSGAAGLEGAYNKLVTGLDTNELYYFRAKTYKYTDPVYGDWLTFFTGPEIVNTKAELDSVSARVKLYGEIVSALGQTVVERGFEYKIQDAEPAAEDMGVEVSEFGSGFAEEEFNLKNKALYDQVEGTVWWFRTYFRDDGANKYTADSWMKNLPTVTTQAMTSINYNKADGNGTVASKGASDLTERGFEIKHEYSGTFRDSWKFDIAGFEGELEAETTENDAGVIIDFYWAGDLIKTVLETAGLEVGAYTIIVGQMEFGWPVADDCLIEGKDYKCRAFASNEFGTVYGDEEDFSTPPRVYLTNEPNGNGGGGAPPTVGETTVIKHEGIVNLPEGIHATRRGFRYGTTEAADEFDVHENGSFTNGSYDIMLPDLLPDMTYYIYAYIVVEGIIYEGDVEIITTDPEGTEDEDEYPTPHFSPHGQDYREMSTKVFAESLASQGVIDFSGGKKTLPITNHLIQANPNAKVIADNYLDRFKLAKTRMSVTFPTPLPFEREDTVDFSYGVLLFKEDDEGVVHFKEDGEGASVLMDQISMIIKKINSVGLIKTPESIDYTAVLDLEHE